MRFNLFQNHSQIHYLGKFLGGELPPAIRPAILERWAIKEKALHSADSQDQNARAQLMHAKELSLTPVLSLESLAGGPFCKKRLQAQRFKKFFGPCEIILFIREPVSFLNSFYVQTLRNFNERQFSREKKWMKKIGKPPHYFDINQWMDLTWNHINSQRNYVSYADTARAYAKVFGRKNVHLFIFEEFVQNPQAVITRLCDTLGIDSAEGFRLIDGKRSNERLTTDYIDRIKELQQSETLSNKFRESPPEIRRDMLTPQQIHGEKIRPELSDDWIKKVHLLTRKQNRQILKKWGLPLTEYGYQI